MCVCVYYLEIVLLSDAYCLKFLASLDSDQQAFFF